MPDYSIENDIKLKGYEVVAGVDEAGRGPLAGPVCAAAVILPENCEIEGLNDSKKLSEKKREALYDIIIEKAISYDIQLVDNNVIDEINILQATMLAMTNAVNGLKVKPQFVIIDGNKVPERLQIPADCVVKGDAKSMSIAAASILAKVTRDRLMLELDKKYPEYDFARHKGYGTKLHQEKLLEYGPCEIHRKTFIGKILAKGKNL
ncbi:MAG: ribonuclease HII [Acutalibacteraceae bacterium]|nr:ribonuclease HII [Acutalibacteraceae bacterium]